MRPIRPLVIYEIYDINCMYGSEVCLLIQSRGQGCNAWQWSPSGTLFWNSFLLWIHSWEVRISWQELTYLSVVYNTLTFITVSMLLWRLFPLLSWRSLALNGVAIFCQIYSWFSKTFLKKHISDRQFLQF